MSSDDFETMVRAYAADLFRFAFWLCRNRWQAEDLVQECFASAWRARDALRDQRATKAWLFSILRNQYLSSFQRKRLQTEDVELDDLPSPLDTNGYERVELEECLSALPRSYREPLMLQVLGGFTGREIANMLDITEQNVMTRLSRARQALRRMVNPGSNSTVEDIVKWNA